MTKARYRKARRWFKVLMPAHSAADSPSETSCFIGRFSAGDFSGSSSAAEESFRSVAGVVQGGRQALTFRRFGPRREAAYQRPSYFLSFSRSALVSAVAAADKRAMADS